MKHEFIHLFVVASSVAWMTEGKTFCGAAGTLHSTRTGRVSADLMKFSSRLLVIFLVYAAVSLTGCDGEKPQVKVAAEPPALVENGTVYDRARVDAQGLVKVVLPKDAVVRRTHAPEAIQLFMAKQLQFFGHPPAPVSLRSARAYLGCATRKDGQALRL